MDLQEIYNYTWAMLRTAQNVDAEDIVQDAVFYTWKTMQRREGLTKGYLKRRICYSVANGIKKYDKQQKCEPTDPDDIIVTYHDCVIELPMRRVDNDGNEIRPGLTPRQREVVETIIRCRFEYSLAAKELGISRSTLCFHWNWAKSALRRAFPEGETN